MSPHPRGVKAPELRDILGVMVGGIELVALFPLAQVVLFPRTRVPLHVFEPRYRQLTADALEGSGRVGMVAVPAEHAGAMAGDPPLYPVGCLGRITEARKTSDGRYRFILRGEERFRIRSEPPRPNERLYRVAEVERLDDPLLPEDAARVAALRGRSLELLSELLGRSGDRGAERARELVSRLSGLDDGTFTDALCQSLSFSTLEKQGLLESEGIAERLTRLVGLLDFRLAEAADAPGQKQPTVH
jgi:Lon protease-like protein